jgi:hypothetical protein
LSSRVIIPEVIDEQGRPRADHPPRGRRPAGPPAAGWGALFRALAAGIVLVIGVGAALILGGLLFFIFALVFAVGSLLALLGGKRSSFSRTVIIRSSEDDDSVLRDALLLEREARDRAAGDPRR